MISEERALLEKTIREVHEKRVHQLADKVHKDHKLDFYAKEINLETRRLRKTLIQIREYFEEWKDVSS